MKQLHSKEMFLTFEASGIPPLLQYFVDEVYLPPGNLLIHSGSNWRQYITLADLPALNEEGKRLYANDTAVREATRQNSIYIKKLRDLCMRIERMDEVPWGTIEEFFELIKGFFNTYRYFDVWFTDGAYENKDDPDTAAALRFAEATKNVIRESLMELCFDQGNVYTKALTHIGVLHGVPGEDMAWYFPDDVKALYEGKARTKVELDDRRTAYVHYVDREGISYTLQGREAEGYIEEFDSDAEDVSGLTALKGRTAHGKGTVRGRVRIIIADYIEFSKTEQAMTMMQQGEIMVSTTTGPDLIPAMKLAGAIVTDLGGMLSHAAITARELGIPCLVDTKSATQVFKDGDEVEVDMETGTITLLARA